MKVENLELATICKNELSKIETELSSLKKMLEKNPDRIQVEFCHPSCSTVKIDGERLDHSLIIQVYIAKLEEEKKLIVKQIESL